MDEIRVTHAGGEDRPARRGGQTCVSPYASSFVLKGAALFTLWTGRAHRATRDIDLLGFGEPTEMRLRAIFDEVLGLDIVDDFIVDATKRAQWAGFVRKAGASTEPRDFGEIVREARGFLAEPLAACRASETWAADWEPGPWRRP